MDVSFGVAMLPSEKMELIIYKCVNLQSPARTVSIPILNQALGGNADFNRIVECLKGLLNQHRIEMFKYGGGTIRVPFHKFVAMEGENNFFGDSFVVQITPEGRKYFEGLEEREQCEKQSRMVFVSCGQSAKEEIALGEGIVSLIEKHNGELKGYFAERQNSLEALSRHIFAALDQCSGFVAILHHRGAVHTRSGEHVRASVWIEQEIAIAAFLTQVYAKKFPVVVYIQEGIKREGVREQLRIDPVSFKTSQDVLDDFAKRLADARFHPL
jgi:hypothetical protein